MRDAHYFHMNYICHNNLYTYSHYVGTEIVFRIFHEQTFHKTWNLHIVLVN